MNVCLCFLPGKGRVGRFSMADEVDADSLEDSGEEQLDMDDLLELRGALSRACSLSRAHVPPRRPR